MNARLSKLLIATLIVAGVGSASGLAYHEYARHHPKASGYIPVAQLNFDAIPHAAPDVTMNGFCQNLGHIVEMTVQGRNEGFSLEDLMGDSPAFRSIETQAYKDTRLPEDAGRAKYQSCMANAKSEALASK